MNFRTKKYYYIVGGVILIYISTTVFKFISAVNNTKEPVFSTKPEYLDLFNAKARNNIQTVASYNSKIRNSIALLDYLQGDYNIVVYKIPISINFTINDILISNKQEVSSSSEVVYSKVNGGLFDLLYVASQPPAVAQKIQVLIREDSLTDFIKNENLILFSFPCKGFAIRNNNENVNDICLTISNDKYALSSCLLFLERNSSLYMLFITSNKPNGKVNQDLLLNMVK